MINARLGTTGLARATNEPRERAWWMRLLCGPEDRPMWVRPSLLALLAGVAVLYLWGLGASGTANSFYAAAVLAGTKSWKAFFFGSLDASNFITVDKPPASLWVMEIFARIFGFSSWSMLVPQALEGVGAVALLYAAVRRWAGSVAGLLAAGALALTPVAALMFRFNNPDALLVLLLLAAAYAAIRAIDSGSTRWMILCGSLIGFGFLTKMLQAMIVLPVFGLVYLLCAPGPVRRRLTQLAVGTVAVIVSAGWWVAIVTLIPAADRPYIGGSTNNSVLQLVFGYNGLSRLTGGAEGASGTNFSGVPGLFRLFNTEMGTQIAWLIPAALIGLIGGLWLTRRAPRRDRTRAALLLWGGWFLVTGLVFSFAGGIIHTYYTVALAPGVVAVVAVAARMMWQTRTAWFSRIALAAMTIATGITSVALLNRAPGWYPELQWLVAITTVIAAVCLLAPVTRWRHLMLVGAVCAGVACLGGPAAYAIETAATIHTGSLPSAGPASTTASVTGPGAQGGMPASFAGGGGQRPSGTNGARPAGAPMGSFTAPAGTSTSARGGPGASGAARGPTSVQTGAALIKLLEATDTKWAAATVGAQTAATLELSSGTAVMAIGGFTGSDPAPTLAQFEQYVADGQVRYFIAGGMGGGGGSSTGEQITSWVTAHFKALTVDGQTVYDLTRTTTATAG
jgi:4-amino-4-deoxy-L-arabinose transferase-like glycosyltransferase